MHGWTDARMNWKYKAGMSIRVSKYHIPAKSHPGRRPTTYSLPTMRYIIRMTFSYETISTLCHTDELVTHPYDCSVLSHTWDCYTGNVSSLSAWTQTTYHDIYVTLVSHVHYSNVIISAMASQITSFTIVYSTVCSGADQRKYQSSASLAFVRGIHRLPVNSPHKDAATRKMFPFDDVIMIHMTYT